MQRNISGFEEFIRTWQGVAVAENHCKKWSRKLKECRLFSGQSIWSFLEIERTKTVTTHPFSGPFRHSLMRCPEVCFPTVTDEQLAFMKACFACFSLASKYGFFCSTAGNFLSKIMNKLSFLKYVNSFSELTPHLVILGRNAISASDFHVRTNLSSYRKLMNFWAVIWRKTKT